MTLQEIIQFYQPAVVQIATRTGTGTGFYLRDYDLIVTNNHVVRDLPKALIKGRTFPRQVSKVVYADERHDLAFLLPPTDTSRIPDIHLGDYGAMKDGDRVLAIGHPYGLNYTATEGVISRVSRVQTGLRYIQIDAAINPGNSGGPLVNDKAEVIGVNTFIIKGGDNLGFALPVLYLKEALDLYQPVRSTEMTLRCPSCGTLVTRATLDSGKYCPECGTEISFPPEDVAVEEPLTGITKTIEDILRALGKDPEVARTGQNRWQVEEGSAKIRIFYNPETYFIVSDAYLCRLPRSNIAPLYVYLLRENNDLHGQYFSLQGENILLSGTINNLELTVQSGVETFRQLFAKADAYDGVLMEKYGCAPILEEE